MTAGPLALTLIAALSAAAPSVATTPRLSLEEAAVVVSGLPTGGIEGLAAAPLEIALWESMLRVETVLAEIAEAERPAILGRYTVDGSAVRFRPRFPFVPGQIYRARFSGARFDLLGGHAGPPTPDLEIFFHPGETVAPGDEPRVTAVYPSGDIVPENLLRLYVHFSMPMRQKDAQRHVHLHDSQGDEVTLPFVEVEHGLWDPAGTRLTLFLHPGRIKRGVGPNVALGPPLTAGESYRLTIDTGLRDRRGRELAAPFEKRFGVGPPDRGSPDIETWLVWPPAGAAEPLVADFPEALDHGLLHRLLRVYDAAGFEIVGTVEVSRHERRWSYMPDSAWEPGAYVLRVSHALEDRTGNSLGRRFEEELLDRSHSGRRGGSFEVEFWVGRPPALDGGER